VVVSVTPGEVLVGGVSVVAVGRPDPGSDGPPVDRPLPAELSAPVSDDPACPLPAPQLADARPTVAAAQARATHIRCTGRTMPDATRNA
jgi:hypothetical protein